MNNKTTRRQFMKKASQAGVLIGLAEGGLVIKGCSTQKEYDCIISNGIVFDGLGDEGKELDVAILGDRIAAVGNNLNKAKAAEVIDAGGLAVAPGFIDPHSHTDYLLMINPKAESKIRQGVTTEIGGNCGLSYFPFSESQFEDNKERIKKEYGFEITWKDISGFFSRLEETGMALNFATHVGHGTVRESIVGFEDRKPDKNELTLMKKAVRDSMDAGAVGLSTGLYYAPGSYAETDEITELCREVAALNGVHASHIRDEGDHVVESVEEVISISEKTGVSLEIAHLKAQYSRNFSKINTVLSRITQAKNEGISILADRYPYHASSTSLGSFFPRWAQEGSTDGFMARLKDKSLDRKIREHVQEIEKKVTSWENVVISSVITEKNKHLEGKNIGQGASESGKSPYDFMRDLLIEEENQVSMINFSMSEENLKKILAHPLVVPGSDGSALAPYGALRKGKPHLRNYGTFTRVLGKFVREDKVLTLPQAIRKMTSVPAGKFGLTGRGQVKEGYFADLVVFDPDSVNDRSDWLNPHQYPVGIEYVIVNGRMVIKEGEHTGTLPGMVLKKGVAGV
ncbi:MAG: D-aminoacylase [Candidatus Latescibacteria bacterium]|nr:D-aminoacylase [Candidatus Latescibacterota bacterium]